MKNLLQILANISSVVDVLSAFTVEELFSRSDEFERLSAELYREIFSSDLDGANFSALQLIIEVVVPSLNKKHLCDRIRAVELALAVYIPNAYCANLDDIMSVVAASRPTVLLSLVNECESHCATYLPLPPERHHGMREGDELEYLIIIAYEVFRDVVVLKLLTPYDLDLASRRMNPYK
eukprot:scaffold7799_cov94-Skeletonema_dohrnii-CCMP3373.AAC.10